MIRPMAPWRERLPKPFSRLEEEMESLMERFFGTDEGWISHVGLTMPKVDVVESDDAFEVQVDLPGIYPEDVDLEIREGALCISGEKQQEEEDKGKTYHRVERRSGSFRRVIPLALNVDESKVEATYKDGVLMVTIPKTEEARTKHIKIKT